MAITPIVTPDLYISLLVLSLATISFRQIVRFLARARRTRVTLVPARTSGVDHLPRANLARCASDIVTRST